jgi:Ca2+/H+ antiporter
MKPLTLAFRPVEVVAVALSTALVGLLLARGRTSRLRGWALLAAYAALATAFFLAGR